MSIITDLSAQKTHPAASSPPASAILSTPSDSGSSAVTSPAEAAPPEAFTLQLPTPTLQPTVPGITPPANDPSTISAPPGGGGISIPAPPPLPPNPTPTAAAPTPTASPLVSSLPQLPDLSSIEKELNQHGVLLPDLYVQPTWKEVAQSPLADLQPDRLKGGGEEITPPPQHPIPNIPEESMLANAGAVSPQTPPPVRSTQTEAGMAVPYWIGIVGILLVEVVQAVFQTWHFFAVQYPQLEQLVIMNHIPQTEMNTYTMKGIELAGTVILSFIFMLLVFLCRKHASRIVIYALSIALIMGNIYIQNVYVQPLFASGNPLEIPHIMEEIRTRPQIDTTQLSQPILQLQPSSTPLSFPTQ